MLKYEFTKNSKVVNVKGVDVLVREIRALTDFSASHDFIQKGTVGGYIESEYNLSQKGTCWLDKDSVVLGEGRLLGKAYLKSGMIYDKAQVTDAFVDTSIIKGLTAIWGASKIIRSTIEGNSNIFGSTYIDASRLEDFSVCFAEGADEEIRGNVVIVSCQLSDCIIEMFKDGEVRAQNVKGTTIEMAIMSRTHLSSVHFINATDMRFHSDLDEWNELEGTPLKDLYIVDTSLWMLDSKIGGQASLHGNLSFARATVTDYAIVRNESKARQSFANSTLMDMSSVVFKSSITEEAKHTLQLSSDEQIIFENNI